MEINNLVVIISAIVMLLLTVYNKEKLCLINLTNVRRPPLNCDTSLGPNPKVDSNVLITGMY